MQRNVLLLSIRPEYALKIFNGTKKIELRRVRPRLEKGDLVIVYVSSPTKALLGSFEVERVIEKLVIHLWQDVEEQAGINLKEFFNYYQGKTVGFGICLRNIQTFHPPIELERLRREWSEFRPPQGYRYLTPGEFERVQALVKEQVAVMPES